MTYILYFDGACRGSRPLKRSFKTPAGADAEAVVPSSSSSTVVAGGGWVLYHRVGRSRNRRLEVLAEGCQQFASMPNSNCNEVAAAYHSLIAGLHALDREARYDCCSIGERYRSPTAMDGWYRYHSLIVRSDLDIVLQLAGLHKVRNPYIQTLYDEVCRLLERCPNVTFQRVERHDNSEADALANQAMDEGGLTFSRPIYRNPTSSDQREPLRGKVALTGIRPRKERRNASAL